MVEVMKKPLYRAVFDRDEDNYWSVVVVIDKKRSAVSDGQTVPKARRRIREAVALLLDVSVNAFELEEEFLLPTPLQKNLKELRLTKEKLAELEKKYAEIRGKVVKGMTKQHISRRDAGDILGLTGARVDQILKTKSAS